MSDFEKCYCKLFNDITDIIKEMENENCNIQLQCYIKKLKEAQCSAEKAFIDSNT